ncbi:hypothetical protein EDC94DRAFT_663564 [Helicostylum pulchrum]|nr:hypothetical protein EDC94DRAFT_663564 [Helicostylum pulchrum]
MVMYQSSGDAVPALTTLALYEEWLVPGQTSKELVTEKWERRITKLLKLRKMIKFEGSDQYYLKEAETMMILDETRVGEHMILINSWHFPLTVSKLQSIMTPQILDMMPRVHKHLTACMTIVKYELKLEPYRGKVGNYVDVMETDLKSQVIEEYGCGYDACPNA